MNRKKILNMFYIFLLLKPFLDLFTSLMTKFLDLPITIGIVIRGIIFLICLIYIFVLSKSKYKKQSIIYLVILFVYSCIYFLTKKELLLNYSFLYTELVYMFKYYYILITLLFLFNFFDDYKPNNRKIFRIIQIDLFLYCFLIVLANITHTAFATYVGGSGNTGWFYSGNEIGIIITLLFPFLYLLINKAASYKILLYVIPITLGIEMIGTKTSIIGLLLPTLFFSLYYLLKVKKNKGKQMVMTWLILLVILASCPNLPVIQNIKNSIMRYEERQNKDMDEDYSKGFMSSILLSDRDFFAKKIKKIYNQRGIEDQLFGIGFVNRKEINNKNINKLIEMDFHDIFYRYGIVGFLIYIMPFIYITFKIFEKCRKKKFKLNIKQIILLYTVYINLLIALIVGHVLGAPAVSGYLATCFVLLVYYLKYDQHNIELDNNSITIMALHLGVGGIEKYLSSLCKILEDDYNINLVSTYKVTEKPAFYFSDKINITYLINDYPRKKEFKEAIKNKNVFQIIKYGFSLARIFILKYVKNILYIEEINSKYIITTRSFHNTLVGNNKNRDIIAIATEHNYHNNNKAYINNLINSCQNIDYLVVVSEELKEFYSKKLKEYHQKTKCIYIPNVLDDIPKYHSKQEINNKLISIGRLVPEKGYDDLIEIIKLIKENITNIHLDIYGDGPQREMLENKVKELELDNNIKLCGFYPHEELLKILEDYDMYLMTSHTESFGLVLIEAMSKSVPCIAFDRASGAKKVLSPNNGILISNNDKKEYAKTVVKYLNNEDKLNSISKNGYNSIKKYEISEVKKIWDSLLKKINEGDNNEK